MTVTQFTVQTTPVGAHQLVRILQGEVSKKLQIQRLNDLGRLRRGSGLGRLARQAME
jgi:hypothetical protein